jgi:hypothetical protein
MGKQDGKPNLTVYYQVNRTSSFEINTIQYRSHRFSGLAKSMDMFFDQITSGLPPSVADIELIQVENVIPVRFSSHRTIEPKSGKVYQSVALPSIDLEALFSTHRYCDIPVYQTVNFVCRVRGVKLGAFLKSLGYNRNYLNLTLRGERKPPADLKEAVIKSLGIDPWLYTEDAEPVVIERRVVPINELRPQQ